MVSFDTVSVPPPADQPEGKGEGEGEEESVPAPPVLATETAVSRHVVPLNMNRSNAPNTV